MSTRITFPGNWPIGRRIRIVGFSPYSELWAKDFPHLARQVKHQDAVIRKDEALVFDKPVNLGFDYAVAKDNPVVLNPDGTGSIRVFYLQDIFAEFIDDPDGNY